MRYEWDERKNGQNQRKHEGISFEFGVLVFEDEYCLVGLDRVDASGEQRWHAIGRVSIEPNSSAVLMVVHAYRENRDGEEIVRIISARRAEKHEFRRYQKQAMD
ncbi:MAG: BrnT family toxin [Acidobacteriota bacterium]